jgi:quinoprotein glucose dehydrogenase
VTESKVFLDLRDRVMYKDRENEEGLLGFAFHPKYRENGEFYLYYTTRDAEHTSVVSRFKVSGGDPDRADPSSEEELMRIPQPFWNHNGGTVCFGPDGYLYIGLGDGGSANDPQGNGQNLNTWLGSILRIDVDRKDEGLAYGVPKDNPFVGKGDARPEIYAYGLRNVWRMEFDRETGTLWAGDVGQNLWEEIDIITKGGNYGWAVRESAHAFGPSGSGPKPELIEPIWEYDHQVGKSITGGLVYRGKKFPELAGKYLYADYVSGRIWALKYDESSGKVVTNEEIPAPAGAFPIITFGDDEQGEVYFTIVSPKGEGVYTFARNE